MPDEPKKSNKSLAVIALVLLCALVAVWLVRKAKKTPNTAPIAALQLDAVDETNRVATLSDGGSHDPDGTLLSWRIAWGDGQEQDLSSLPQKVAHTYATEGEYKISLWCVDNLGATSSPPAITNITLDFLKRQKALEAQREADRLKTEEARKQAEAQREADRLRQEEARKQAERLAQERQRELAAREAQKIREQQELEQKRRAEAELARQKAKEAAKPRPTPLAEALSDNRSSRKVIYTPAGCSLGEFQICKEKTEGKGNDGNFLVILFTRCVNFPDTPIPISDWRIDDKPGHVQARRIRLSLSPGRHEVTALFTPMGDSEPERLKADVSVETTGECVVIPRK